MNILLYCPLNPKGPRIYARTIQSIFALEWGGYLDVVFGKQDALPAGQKGGENLIEKHNRIRGYALAGGYDAVLMVEADMIVPPDTLIRLTAIETDVAYGLYCSRHGGHQWLAFSQLSRSTGTSIGKDRRYCAEHWGKVIQTKGVGMGCTLIRRNVLQALEFHKDGPCADDWYFSLDCARLGFRQHHDLGVVCGHIVSETKKIVWPSIETEAMREFEALL